MKEKNKNKESEFQIQTNEYKTIYEELNICEFPVTVLSTQPVHKPYEAKDTIILDSEVVERKWIIDGSIKLGIPIAIDESTLIIILSYFTEIIKTASNLYDIGFSSFDFLKKAKWPIDEPHYAMLHRSLLRLALAKYRTIRSFFKKEGQKKGRYMEEHIFSLFDDVKIYGLNPTGDEEIDFHIWDMKYHHIRLSQTLIESIKSGNIKPTNLEFYLSLEKPIARRQYRYYDKRFYQQGIFSIDIERLAFGHLGLMKQGYMVKDKYVDIHKVKRTLDVGHKELQEKGYIKSWKYDHGYLTVERAPQKNIEPVVIDVKQLPTSSEIQQKKKKSELIYKAKDLVMKFHTSLNHVVFEIPPSELKSAAKLLRDYGVELANYIVDYAICRIKEKGDGSNIRSFGYVMIFINSAIEAYKEEQQEKENIKKIEKSVKENSDARSEFEKYINKYTNLPKEKQEKLWSKAIELLKQQGIKEERITETGIELQIVELLKEGVTI
jgi:hypothetical protein